MSGKIKISWEEYFSGGATEEENDVKNVKESMLDLQAKKHKQKQRRTKEEVVKSKERLQDFSTDLINRSGVSDKIKEMAKKFASQGPPNLTDVVIMSNAKSKIMNPTQTIVTTFRITRQGTTCNYAYLYSDWNTKRLQFNDLTVCIGSALSSYDGEYRRLLLPWDQLYYIDENPNIKKLLKVSEDIITEMINSREIELRSDIYYPKFAEFSQKSFEDHINNSRWAIYLLSIQWLYYYRLIDSMSQENHMNPAFQYIMYQKKMRPIYKKIYDKYSTPYNELYILLNNGRRNMRRWGQKLFPLSKEDVVNLDSLLSDKWREYYIGKKASLLSVNFVAPGFNYGKVWLIAQNTTPAIFDNNMQYIKYARSKLGQEIKDTLAEKEQKTYELIDEDANIKKYYSAEFKDLSQMLKNIERYTEENIILTDLVLVVFSPYVGRTFRDLVPLSKSNEPIFSNYKNILLDINIFKSILFNMTYGFLTMNRFAGVIHMDLHSNNFVIDFRNPPMPNLCYVFKYFDTVYYVPYYGFNSYIIDYSRSVLRDLAEIAQREGQDVADKIKNKQEGMIMKTLVKLFPEYMKDIKKFKTIKDYMRQNYDDFFRIITLIDPYFSAHSMLLALSAPDAPSMSSEIIDLLKKYKSAAGDQLIEYLNAIVAGKSLGKIGWPIEDLLGLFSDYLSEEVLNRASGVLTIFSTDYGIKGTLNKKDSFFPLAMKDKKLIEAYYDLKKDFAKNINKLKNIYINNIDREEITILGS